MATSQPFLCTSNGDHVCVICGLRVVIRSEARYKKLITFKKDLTTVKDHARKWKDLNVPADDSFFQFTTAYNRLADINEGYVHNNCALNLRTKQGNYDKIVQAPVHNSMDFDIETESQPSNAIPCTRSTLAISTDHKEKKYHCFSCNLDNGTKIHRVSTESRRQQIFDALKYHIGRPNSSNFQSAKRLDVMLKGSADIFAADIHYHLQCFDSFTRFTSCKEAEDPMVALVLSYFSNYITLKICKEKNAYLLHDLLNDSKIICDEHNIPPIFTHTKGLRRYLENNLNDIGFAKSGKYVVVHPLDIDPILYSNSTLKGHGLRKNDIIGSFAKMIHRISDEYLDKPHSEWPCSVADLIAGLDNDQPIVELFNVIYMTMCKTWKRSVALNEHGFAKIDSQNIAQKIWCLASDWTALITGIKNAKQIALALYVHRLTASKEVITALWKSGHAISPNDVRLQNEEFLSTSDDIVGALSGLMKETSTHSSLDNNDQCQDTSTGKNTTHHTNFLIFQPNPPQDGIPVESSNTNYTTSSIESNANYKIGKLVPPKPFPNFVDIECTNLIEQSFKKDILWSLAGGLPSEDGGLPLLGSWTAYMKNTAKEETVRSLIKYLPANENPPEHGVCKDYLEYIMEVMGILDIKEIFVHADEQVYARICQLIWKYREKFKNIIPLMGGFHQLRVFQKILYKRYGVFGYQAWYADAGVIAEGSAEQAFGGKHYYRSMRIHKEGFDALSQIRISDLTNEYALLDAGFLEKLKTLRRNPSDAIVEDILSSASFMTLYQEFIKPTGPKSEITLNYLKDISLMLSIVSAVREGCIERHLQAERQFLKLVFAFDHINYARYNTYQHVLLSELRRTGSSAYQQLLTNGFGCTASDGGKFNSKHGDLETEHFNRETKGTAGPFRSGYSTNIHAVNRWIKTTHCHAALRKAMKKRFRMYISSTHKEMTPKNKKLHESHVKALKQKLSDYNVDPFQPGPAVNIVTGKEIDPAIVTGLCEASTLGDNKFKLFVKDTLVTGSKSIFETIKKNKIDIGIKETRKENSKKVDVLIEEKKAFGMMVSKCESKVEAFSYPMTSLPLSIANPNGSLYGSNKAKFRNDLIGELYSLEPENDAVWIVDCGHAIRQVKPRETYREYFDDLLDWMIPDAKYCPKKLVMAVDIYLKESTKELERKERRGGKEEGKRIHVTGFDQKMPIGKQKWIDFLSNGENKNDLMASFGRFLREHLRNRNIGEMEITFCGKQVWSWCNGQFAEEEFCNHEEADTKVPLYALNSNSHVVVVAEDCDIFVLLLTVFAIRKPLFKWSIQFGGFKYADVEKMVRNLGYDVCKLLVHFHAITGCDTTSYFYRIGKSNPFKKAVQEGKLDLISELGTQTTISSECIKNCQEFIRTVLYKGKANETYVETRVRLYKQQPSKSKTTMTLPPDIDSCTQHILRCHLLIFKWTNCDKSVIPHIDPFENGWKLSGDRDVLPVWFTGPQFPPSCTSRKSKEKTPNDGYDADSERMVPETTTRKKRTKQSKMNVRSRKFRKKLPELIAEDDEEERNSSNDLEHPVDPDVEIPDYSGYQRTESEGESVTGDNELSDEWERYSDFEPTESSGSDWM